MTTNNEDSSMSEAEKPRPKQDSLPPPELKDLLGDLGTMRDSRPLTPDDVKETWITMMNAASPESIWQIFQQILSSPQEMEQLTERLLKMQNMADEDIKKLMGKFRMAVQQMKGVDPGWFQYVLQQVGGLSPEERESFWRGDQPPETLLNFADLQAYVEQHNLDLSAMMNPQTPQVASDLVETNTKPVVESAPPPIEQPVQGEQTSVPLVTDSSMQETASSIDKTEEP